MKQKLTPWFPASVKPVHVGVYEIDTGVFKLWDGYVWGSAGWDPDKAFDSRDMESYSQHNVWRGLAEKPK